MLYAKAPGTQELIPAVKGTKAYCPDCDAELIPKCGPVNCDHWAHKSVSNCDSRYHDGMSEWHYQWQRQINNPIPGVNIEVPIVTEERYKRADLKPGHGVIIEFQRSHLPLEERLLRERHYKNMIWVVHSDRRGSKTWKRTRREKVIDWRYKPHYNEWVFSNTPVVFDLNNGEMLCRLNIYRFSISKERFIKTFINGRVCNDEIWKKIRERSERKQDFKCDLSWHCHNAACDNPPHILITCEKTCRIRDIPIMFTFFNGVMEIVEGIIRKEREEKERVEKERRYFADPESLQNYCRLIAKESSLFGEVDHIKHKVVTEGLLRERLTLQKRLEEEEKTARAWEKHHAIQREIKKQEEDLKKGMLENTLVPVPDKMKAGKFAMGVSS